MKTLNLKEIIEKHSLDVKEVAEQLFPKNQYPSLALSRIISGKALLDTDQVSKLSLMTGVPIECLYSGGEWKINTSENLMTFETGEYKAELDTEKWVTKVFHKQSLIHETIIHSGSIALSIYLRELTEVIIKHNKP